MFWHSVTLGDADSWVDVCNGVLGAPMRRALAIMQAEPFVAMQFVAPCESGAAAQRR